MMKFSVLMSIYYKEQPSFFDEAMQSVWDEQMLKPDEIVLVEDGVLTDALYQMIAKWESRLGDVLKRVVLSENQGLGNALNAGLQKCQYDYIARMDTDDVCTPDRFAKQVRMLQEKPEIEILGGQILEFSEEIGDLPISRKLPTKGGELIDFAKKRNPFNHPTVFYKKVAVQKAGAYQNDYLYEDYALWVRAINRGINIANLPEIVLYMRAGDAMIKRRGGLKYAINEAKAQYGFYKIGFLSAFELSRNLMIRFPVRMLPNQLRVFFYEKFLRGQR